MVKNINSLDFHERLENAISWDVDKFSDDTNLAAEEIITCVLLWPTNVYSSIHWMIVAVFLKGLVYSGALTVIWQLFIL